jgi:D-alanyl-lipoteichoic acid acyltransferase DltB (MBOAT superfamily)
LAAGAFQLAAGIALMAASTTLPVPPAVAGMAGLAGFVLALHFGAFHLLALAWQTAGFDVRPIMNRPLAATSLADFWSRRWNLAFRDLAHRLVFVPVKDHTKPLVAVLAVFVVSGVVHDAVISVPAGAGYGLPTLYFLIQAAGFLLQRTQFSRRMGLASGPLGRLTTAVIVLAPVQLLFHQAFLDRVMRPLVASIHYTILT